MYKVVKKDKMQGKKRAHKDAIVKSLVIELIRAQKIKTTPTKAKIIKSKFDRLVTHAKKGKVGGKKVIESFFASDERAITRFYSIVEANLNDRDSGYTRIIKTLPRKGDNAEQAYIMLVNISSKVKKSEISKVLEKQQKKKEKSSTAAKVSKALSKVNPLSK